MVVFQCGAKNQSRTCPESFADFRDLSDHVETIHARALRRASSKLPEIGRSPHGNKYGLPVVRPDPVKATPLCLCGHHRAMHRFLGGGRCATCIKCEMFTLR